MRLPYPGLRAFRTDETDIFFGREACAEQMVDRLGETHFLAVLGASGSGKSSLVRTGLLDSLGLGLLAEAGSAWLTADMRPAGNPVVNLARALLRAKTKSAAEPEAASVADLAAFLRRGPRAVIEWCLAGNLPPRTSLLILADQFEELFRYSDYSGQQEAEKFVALLIESARSRSAPIYVVITMRSEYLGPCALIPELAEQVNAGLYLTRRMTREETRAAIVGPAAVCGFTIDDGLVTRLLNDLASFAAWETEQNADRLQVLARRADQLPLMQHVLNRLWLQARAAGRAPIVLREDDYDTLGGLTAALSKHADEVLKTPGVDAGVAEIVFKALVSGDAVASAIRRPCRFDELVTLAGGRRAAVAAVIEAFRDPECNFLLTSPEGALADDTTVDISHESLIRQWETLTGWMLEEARAAAAYRAYERNAEAWRNGRIGLLREDELRAALRWREGASAAWAKRYSQPPDEVRRFETVTDYIAQSERHRRQVRTAKRSGAAVLAGAALLLVFVYGSKVFKDYATGVAEGYYSGHGAKQDYAQAVAWYEKAAFFGDAPAEVNIGDIYDQGGYGVTQNYATAYGWYMKAARRGNVDAMEDLGTLYYYGHGVPRDYRQAMIWSRKAADAGNVEAAFHVALLYADGDGVTQSYGQALGWYKIAADGGNAAAQVNLGLMYEDGDAVPQSYWQAYNWFMKAAASNDGNADEDLGELYQDGDLGAPDYSLAMSWYLQASSNGYALADSAIGELFRNGLGVTQDYKQAMFWYKKGDEAGDSYSTNDIGVLYGNGDGVKQDYAEALVWYRKAAAMGNMIAEANIGLYYDEGLAVKQDYGQAMAWYLKAAAQGDLYAQNNIGLLYQYGRGVKQSYGLAMHWYQMAAAGGDAVSDANIARLYQNGEGVKTDDAQAETYFEKAIATKGDGFVDAELGLAELYFAKNDEMDGINWVVTAAKDGSAGAQDYLGTAYMSGQDVGGVNFSEAFHWYSLAADGGSADAESQLGLMYLLGEGVKQNDGKAVALFAAGNDETAAAAEDGIGQAFLNGNGVPKDLVRAVKWLQKAGNDGSADAARQLGVLYLAGAGVKQDDKAAVMWIGKAGGSDAADAENTIGTYYMFGLHGLPVNKPAAMKWYFKAAHDGSALGAENIAKNTASPMAARAAYKQAVTLAAAPTLPDLAADYNLAGEPKVAIAYATKALAADPGAIYLQADVADARMMLRNTAAARKIFFSYRPDQDDGDGESWKTRVLDNFNELRRLGYRFALMREVRAEMASVKVYGD